MADLISRSALRKCFSTKPHDYYSTTYILDEIDSAPTVDPEARAQWTQRYKSGLSVPNGYISSCCDCWNERKTSYCPNCGAEMEVSRDEG